ncbi:SNRPB [Candida pseudojiufengensis]|uniref:SNRPB n=1 Tax=Candida pseudojiufengensis TaxID=497109 RepID=UPI002224A077|nr:SNRPB [Candida pseudojiufengensis]KAI5962223.1 SNRPB [Candida pseudojiufengensis]
MSVKLPINKKTRMSDLINYRLKITTIDNRTYIGSLLSFDKYMNLVLSDCEESRITKKSWQELKNKSKKSNKSILNTTTTTNNTPLFPTEIPKSNKPDVVKRQLGLIILRGEQIVNFSIETGPLTDIKTRVAIGKKGRIMKQPVGKLKKIA